MNMKKTVALLGLFFCVGLNAQQNNVGIKGDSNWFNSWTNFKPKTVEYPSASQILTGVIGQDTTLKNGVVYLLSGTVYVANNATLTIEPGCIIRGDFDTNGTLVVTKGSKLIAEGKETDPIVFTSNKKGADRKSGDWGGVIIYGDAPLNRLGGTIASIYDPNPAYNNFGGNNEDHDGGILKYVRIEFAGKKINEKTMLNGLTLGACGKKTKVEYVQISFAKDDAVEVIGGNFDMSNIISYRNADDDFDYSMGVQTTLSNSILIRSPFISDNTRSRGFEIDSYDKVENFDPTKKKTLVKLKNVSMIIDEPGNMSLVKEAISLKSDSYIEMENCLVVGFSSFIAFDDKFLEGEFKKIKIKNTTVDTCTELFTNETLNKVTNVLDYFSSQPNSFYVTSFGVNNLFKNIDVKKKPDFRLK